MALRIDGGKTEMQQRQQPGQRCGRWLQDLMPSGRLGLARENDWVCELVT